MESPSLFLYRDRFIYTFSLIGILSTLVFGVAQHINVGNKGLALFELVLSSLALLNLVYYHFRKNYVLASNVILVLMVITLNSLLITGGLRGTGIYWIHTFPLLAFFMKPIHQALLWNLFFMFTSFLLFWAGSRGYINFYYGWVEIRQAIGAYTAVALLSMFYSLILRKLILNLRERATVDILTGLYNRAFAFETLSKTVELVKRENGRRYCIAYMDIDNFKSVNDTYGHGEGDKVLKRIASILSENFRKGDVVSRIGGDEFLVIIYDCDKEALKKRLERIKKSIETEMRKHRLSLSYGIVEIPKEGTEVSQILNLADKRMYEMKRSKKE